MERETLPPLNFAMHFRKRAEDIRATARTMSSDMGQILLEAAGVWDRMAEDEERHRSRDARGAT